MHLLRRLVVTLVGAALLLVGVALMVLPGPGILLLVAGFAVLASEYVWAQVLLRRAKEKAQAVQEAAVASRWRTAGSVAFALGMVGVGVAAAVVPDVPWPVADDLLDRVWSPVTGGILVVTGAILLTTTVLTVRLAAGHPTTHVAPGQGGATVWRPPA